MSIKCIECGQNISMGNPVPEDLTRDEQLCNLCYKRENPDEPTRVVVIGGHRVTQLGGGQYEAANAAEKVDFVIEQIDRREFALTVFDSTVPADHEDAYIESFQTSTLEEAVKIAFEWTRPKEEGK